MNVVWSIEAIGSDKITLTKAEVYIAVASIVLWKKINPKDRLYLFCDSVYYNFFSELGIIELWDVVDNTTLPGETEINKRVFWASSKMIAISKVEAPLVHLDFDFICWRNLRDYGFFDSELSTAFFEKTAGYYEDPKKLMREIKLPYPINGFTGSAYNTCILYILTNVFRREFTENSLHFMKEASKLDMSEVYNRNPSLVMIFAEQQMLGEMAEKFRFRVKTILKEKLNPSKRRYEKYGDGKNGIFDVGNAGNYFTHYGEYKKEIRESEEKHDTQIEVVTYIINQVAPDYKKYFSKIG